MRTLIVVALICAIAGLFGSLAMHLLAISGHTLAMSDRPIAVLYQVTGLVLTICHGLPPILLAIVLLYRQEPQ